jgi:AAA family ATP:ADP antiporter
VLLIEQYWSFINSVLSRDQAKRVNGPICGVASIGGIAGGAAVGALAEPLGSHVLILFAAASTVPAAACGWLAYRLGGEPAASESRREAHGTLALDLFGRYGTLRLVGLMVVATQVVSTVLDLRFSGLLEAEIDVTDQRTAYLGTFWSTVNGVTFGLQFVAVPLLLRYLSLRVVHMGLPLLHLTAAAILILYPSLAVAAAAFLLFKTVDYSVFRAAKEILYMPLPFDARYRAKEVIDAVGYRAAKGGIATILAVGGAAVRELPGALYPGIGALASGFWLALVAGYLPREEASEP